MIRFTMNCKFSPYNAAKSESFFYPFDLVLIVEGSLFIDELERKPSGGKFPFLGVGCRHSGGHFPADTLHCVPALETVLIATSVLPERAPSPLGVR